MAFLGGNGHVWVRASVQKCRHLRTRLPVEAIMAEQPAAPIPPDYAEAFAYAVLVYGDLDA